MIQQKFGLPTFKIPQSYGGKLRNRAKGRGARPLCTKRSIHLLLWSSGAVATKSLVRTENRRVIHFALKKLAAKFGVKVYRIGNAGNHLHLIIKLSNRFAYSCFIRALTGSLALKLKIKWDYRPFTRIVEWGKDFKRACDYIYLNELEGAGFIGYSSTRLRGVQLHPFEESS